MIKCPEGCGECCGPILFDKPYFERFKHLITVKYIIKTYGNNDQIVPVGPSLDCVFLDEKKRCKIYNDRPQICRDYGIREDLPCEREKV